MDLQLNQILEAVTECTGTSADDLKSSNRNRKLSESRFLFFFFSLYLTNKSCREVGSFVNRKHNTAIHGANKAVELKKYHKDFYLKLKKINDKLTLT
ncbi:helix-turn-helix domain-containing protein [Flavobacterium sp. I3-2]|uniref:helix-turn-helix domain-containing protein n=1 Tax=Flavobacterium sp. I3-2 TaxID=2748319 RepID=UPI0015B00353|nr:helix-turn-helix domain-containing protein [Flavobacterium sp. I3-2]